MNLTTPLMEIIDHTTETIRSRRLQREEKARVLSAMVATRALRPSDVYVRSLTPARSLPGLLVTQRRVKTGSYHAPLQPIVHPTRSGLELKWDTPVGDILDYLKRRLIAV